MERLGRLMRDWRDEHALTQPEAAELAGIHPATWGYTERGDDPDRQPSARAIRGIARVIGLTPVEAMRLAGREPTVTDAAMVGVTVLEDLLGRIRDLERRVEALAGAARELVDDGPDDDPDEDEPG
jgi:transcriptional regulator with XRE-family HTH domain